jgi:hypothetical protein
MIIADVAGEFSVLNAIVDRREMLREGLATEDTKN